MDDFLHFKPMTVAGVPFAPQLVSFQGEEGLSQLFRFELELRVAHHVPVPPLAALLGKEATFSLRLDVPLDQPLEHPAKPAPADLDGAPRRYFHGHISSFKFVGLLHEHRLYRAEIVPPLWFLTRTANCRIFEGAKLEVGTIIDQVLETLNQLTAYDWIGGAAVVSRKWPSEYCVQYCESDYQFLARLLEEHGMPYYFLPLWKNEKHRLQLVADTSIAPPKCLAAPVTYRSLEHGVGPDGIAKWERGCQFISNKFTLKDASWGAVEAVSSTPARADIPTTPASEWLEYPGGLRTDVNEMPATIPPDLSEWRMQELEAGFDVAKGESNCRRFFAGGTFAFNDDGAGIANWLVTRVHHWAHAAEPKSNGPSGSPSASHAGREPAYGNDFECIPYDVARPYRPARTTPRPRVAGPQTAQVVGSDATTMPAATAPATVDTDGLGRVRVKFRWQRTKVAAAESDCSAWVRVSQAWAGNGWGSMHLPSVGDEVIVDFEDGDPDRPLITGRVYNPSRPVPGTHPLPASKYHAVVARDSLNNEIYLDGSTAGVVLGSLPSGGGGGDDDDEKTTKKAAALIGLGGGFTAISEEAGNWIQLGSKFEISGGATFEAFMGSACSVFVGDSSEMLVGISRSLALADSSEFVVGSTYAFSLASNIAFKADADLEFRVGGGVTITCAKEVAYNTFDSGMMSAKGLTFLAGLADRSSLDMTPKGLELRYGQPMGLSKCIPTIATATAGVLTGAMGVLEAGGAVVPVVTSGYAGLAQGVLGVLNVAATASAEGASAANEDDMEAGTEDYASGWGLDAAKQVTQWSEGFVSGTVLGVAGVVEGAAMAVTNLAVALAALIALKSLEEKPPEKLSAGLRMSSTGALLLGMPPGGQLPATGELAKQTSASYVDLSYNAAINSPNMVQLCAAGSVQIGTDFCAQTTPAINIGTSSATVAIKGSSITGNNSSLLVT